VRDNTIPPRKETGLDDGEVEVIRSPVDLAHVTELAEATFGDLVKAVVDVRQAIMAIGGGMHADEEAALIDEGSIQGDLWGINLYPAEYGTSGWIEFDSMINLRPSQGNRSRSVEDPALRDRIVTIVGRLVAT
jgi:hypothetical protein